MLDSMTVQFVARAKRGLLAAALIAGAVIPLAAPAMPVAAQTAPVGSISFSPATVTRGVVPTPPATDTFAVDVVASNTTVLIQGWQFAFNFDATKLKVNSVTESDEFLGTYATANGLGTFKNPCSINNTTGLVQGCASALTGATTAQGTNVGARMLTINFQSVANTPTGASALTMVVGASGSFLSSASGTASTTLNSGSVQIGPVNGPTLSITSPSTSSPASPANATFNVAFSVSNTGTAASTAGTATVAVTNATPASASVAVAAIAAGGTSGPLTAGVFTISAGQTLSDVTVTLGSATGTTAYSFASFNATGTTAVTATLAGTLTLTAPPAITAFPLTPGNNTAGGTATDLLNVKSNLSSYNVTVAGENTGKMTEFNPGTSAYILPPTGAQLANALRVKHDTAADVTLSDTAQPFVSNTRANYNAAGTGDNYTIKYGQTVTGNDPAVNPPDTYREVITWAAAGIF